MQPSDDQPPTDRPGTPPRPPYSPVTPVLSHLAPVPNNNNGNGFPASSIVPPRSPSPTSRVAPFGLPPPPPPPSFVPEPAPVPISESENPDAIALRSALSILQMQKQQSLRDMRTLERLKKAAAADPEGFARELAAGNLSAKEAGFVNFTHEDGDEDEGEDGDGDGEGRQREGSRAGLGTIPTPQNVVRMPPVNWAKYQIVGEPLDRMHEDQQRRPFAGEPRREDPMQRAPEHVLASPYRPLVDRLETPGKVKGTGKSKK
ncbi:hypothetical protein P170DRAFT_326013, partial [Aspergillus steynii IBT 23096]